MAAHSVAGRGGERLEGAWWVRASRCRLEPLAGQAPDDKPLARILNTLGRGCRLGPGRQKKDLIFVSFEL